MGNKLMWIWHVYVCIDASEFCGGSMLINVSVSAGIPYKRCCFKSHG